MFRMDISLQGAGGSPCPQNCHGKQWHELPAAGGSDTFGDHLDRNEPIVARSGSEPGTLPCSLGSRVFFVSGR